MWTYHCMKEGDEWKVAFHMNCRLFEPLGMFFRLMNSPSTFRTMMNDIFQDLIMEGVVCVYLDNILIFCEIHGAVLGHLTCAQTPSKTPAFPST